jgi:uncharacterized protein (TIGR02466 family)
MAEHLPSRSLSNFGGWQSEPSLFTNASLSDAPGILQARDMIERGLEAYIRELAGPQAGGEITVEMDAAWANVNSCSSWNSPHGHTGDISGALYLSCPGGPCEIAFIDPRVAAALPHRDLLSDAQAAMAKAQGVGQVQKELREGDLVIFPTWVEHHVPVLRSCGAAAADESKKAKPKGKKAKGRPKAKKERLSISFNTNIAKVTHSTSGSEPPLRVRFVAAGESPASPGVREDL